MNTLELRDLLMKFQRKEIFKGVFACDMLPDTFSLPAAFVINLSPISQPGTHWVALYIAKDGTSEYLDSYGIKPTNKCILHFIKFHSKQNTYNNIQFQHINSNTCGIYAASYIIYKLKKKSMKEYCQKFGKNTFINDVIIQNLYTYLRSL